MEQAFTQIADKLRRAARNQERLHLDCDLVVAILTSRLYPVIAELESEEIASQWHSNGSDNFGWHGEQTERNGLYAGTTEALEPAVESQLAAATITAARRLAKRNKHSRSISSATANLSKSTPTRKQASAD